MKLLLAKALRGVADVLDPPPPTPTSGPLASDGEDDRAMAALGMLDPEVEAWVLCEVRRVSGIAEVTLKGNVPPLLWMHVGTTLRRVADAATLRA